jgi:competence protein ComEC
VAVRRPLLGLAALFALGCLLSDGRGSAAEALRLVCLAAAALSLAAGAGAGRAALAALAAAALALGAAAAAVEALQLESGALRLRLREGTLAPGAQRVTGALRGDAFARDGRLAFVLDADSLIAHGRAEPVGGRIRIEVGGEAQKPRLLDGDRIAVWLSLRPAGGTSDGVAAFGYCKSARLLEPLPAGDEGRVRRRVARARERARGVLADAMPPGTERGLVLAMVLGDRSEIDDATAEAFKASGTYHVLALSGAQVALVAALLASGLRRLQASPWVEAGVTTLAIFGYAGFVGGDVPIARAALMAAAVLLGRALEVDADPANLLGFAALVLLADRPSAAGDVGFQLSFGATLGILAFVAPLTRGLPRLPLRIDLALAASVAAQSALAPLLAGHFHRLAPAAVLLNVAAVPLSAAVLLAGFAVLALAPMGGAGAAGALAWIAARALRLSGDLGPAAEWLDLRVPAPSLAVLALHVAGLGLVLRGRRRRGLAALVAGHAVLACGPVFPAADGRLHLTVIDVGQGDSLLLRSPSGRAIVVDAGGSRDARFDPGERRVAPALWRQGVRRLDALVVSHAHPDHAGGVPFLLRAFRVESSWEGPAPMRDPAWQRLDAALAAAGVRRLAVARGGRLEWDGASIAVLGPAPPRAAPLRVRNEDSLVLDVRFGEVHLLLTGDVTGEAERALRLPPALVLKVPHHGSRTSSGALLTAATRPRLAVVSSGARNPFGHPHPEILERYRRAGTLVLRTDRDGSVHVATDGRRVWVRASGEGQERRIR